MLPQVNQKLVCKKLESSVGALQVRPPQDKTLHCRHSDRGRAWTSTSREAKSDHEDTRQKNFGNLGRE